MHIHYGFSKWPAECWSVDCLLVLSQNNDGNKLKNLSPSVSRRNGVFPKYLSAIRWNRRPVRDNLTSRRLSPYRRTSKSTSLHKITTKHSTSLSNTSFCRSGLKIVIDKCNKWICLLNCLYYIIKTWHDDSLNRPIPIFSYRSIVSRTRTGTKLKFPVTVKFVNSSRQ